MRQRVKFGVAIVVGSLRAAPENVLSYAPKLARSLAPSANGSVWKSTTALAPNLPVPRSVKVPG